MKNVWQTPAQSAPTGAGKALNPDPGFGPATAGTTVPARPTTSTDGILGTVPQSDADVQAISKGEK